MSIIEVNYKASFDDTVKTIERAHNSGEISRKQAREYTDKARKNYGNRNIERVVDNHFGGKLKVREV